MTLEAVREQLSLMGHSVPDDVISAFLSEAGFTGSQQRKQATSHEGQCSFKASFDVFPGAAGRASSRQHDPQAQELRASHGNFQGRRQDSLPAERTGSAAGAWKHRAAQGDNAGTLRGRSHSGSETTIEASSELHWSPKLVLRVCCACSYESAACVFFSRVRSHLACPPASARSVR